MSLDGGWQQILPAGERLLWTDRPQAGLSVRDFLTGRLPFGLVFTLFAVFWTAAVSWVGQDFGAFNIMPLFGIPFILVGLHLIVGAPIWDAYERARSWYALTDEAAYIAADLLGKRTLKRFPIRDMNGIELEDGVSGTVWFQRDVQVHRASRRSQSGIRTRRTYMTTTKTGFKNITSPRKVYALIIQQSNNLARPAIS